MTNFSGSFNTKLTHTFNFNPGRRFGSNLLAELRALKEANQRLSDDNQELRDLCCFLDDDRQKGRKLAREWQRFGRYTASVMRQEVSAYQTKLRQLDDKQQELIRDNLELKELCLYLDEERNNTGGRTAVVCSSCGNSANAVPLRDDGDGSSSSTNADENLHNIAQFGRNGMDLNMRSTLSDQTLQYVRALETRIRQLEEERAVVLNNSATTTGTTTNGGGQVQVTNSTSSDPISGRPEAVVRALQVLEVREQLERERIGNTPPDQLDDGEKALVREMCNVVWRKLEDAPNTGIDQHV
uniref:Coiled-coil domain-containing protein 85C n=1 Tax=Anopheles culicifacies TaxID=139723 RepID=A0A182LU71_9DIPT